MQVLYYTYGTISRYTLDDDHRCFSDLNINFILDSLNNCLDSDESELSIMSYDTHESVGIIGDIITNNNQIERLTFVQTMFCNVFFLFRIMSLIGVILNPIVLLRMCSYSLQSGLFYISFECMITYAVRLYHAMWDVCHDQTSVLGVPVFSTGVPDAYCQRVFSTRAPDLALQRVFNTSDDNPAFAPFVQLFSPSRTLKGEANAPFLTARVFVLTIFCVALFFPLVFCLCAWRHSNPFTHTCVPVRGVLEFPPHTYVTNISDRSLHRSACVISICLHYVLGNGV